MDKKNNNLAFVFPGQGSQSLGMLSDLANSYPEIKQTFEQASDALGENLWRLVQEGPVVQLNQTQFTQPVMLAAGFAVWQVWCRLSSVRPEWVAGHSLGEYTALVCAGGIAFNDALKLVSARATLMQQAVPAGVGAMAAVLGLEDHQVVQVCQQACASEVVAAVNFNSPGQVVIAGHASAVTRAMELAKAQGAKKVVLLPVSVPSHCELMRPAAQGLAEKLAQIELRAPAMTLIHNVDVRAHNAVEVIANALQEQLFKPVRWTETIQFMHDQGVSCFVECGPGKVLAGLNKRIVKQAEHLGIFDSASLQQTLEYLHG